MFWVLTWQISIGFDFWRFKEGTSVSVVFVLTSILYERLEGQPCAGFELDGANQREYLIQIKIILVQKTHTQCIKKVY